MNHTKKQPSAKAYPPEPPRSVAGDQVSMWGGSWRKNDAALWLSRGQKKKEGEDQGPESSPSYYHQTKRER